MSIKHRDIKHPFTAATPSSTFIDQSDGTMVSNNGAGNAEASQRPIDELPVVVGNYLSNSYLGDVFLGGQHSQSPMSQHPFWNLNGNANTNPATNFLGTTDSTDVFFRSNNLNRMVIKNDGKVGINTSSPSSLLANTGNTWTDQFGTPASPINGLRWTHSGNGYAASFVNEDTGTANRTNALLARVNHANPSFISRIFEANANGIGQFGVLTNGVVAVGDTLTTTALNNSKLSIQGSVSSIVTGVTSGTLNLGFTHHSVLVLNGTATTINLPDPTTCAGREYYITGDKSVTQAITLATPAGAIYNPFVDTFGASITLPCRAFTVHYKSDGVNWFVQSFSSDQTLKETIRGAATIVGGAFEVFDADTAPIAYQDPDTIVWEQAKTTALPVTPCYTPVGYRWYVYLTYGYVLQRVHNAAMPATTISGIGALATLNGANPYSNQSTSEIFGTFNLTKTTTSAYRIMTLKGTTSLIFAANSTAGGANSLVITNQWVDYPRNATPRGDFRQGHLNLSYIYKLERI